MDGLIAEERLNAFISTDGDDDRDRPSSVCHDEPLSRLDTNKVLAQSTFQLADAYSSHVATF